MARLRVRFFVVVALLALAPVMRAPAQDAGIATIPEAEASFAVALQQFEAMEYADAANGFRSVLEAYPLNAKTTAAILMAGKALYRGGQFADAVALLETLERQYPRSRYVRDARETIRLANEALEREASATLITLGVLLPDSDDNISLTQSLFNGIRIAVDAHNATGDGSFPVRLVFRSSGSNDYDAVFNDFATTGADAVIGPLYSSEAVAAAASAERFQIPLVAPLATDERVAAGRRFVFQANPTPAERGRAMARFAVESLRHSQLGIIAEGGNELSERMAEGFEDAALELGAELLFIELLPSSTSWFRIADRVRSDSLYGAQAIYLPITGGQARSLIKAAMDGLDNLDMQVRLLGNKEWHDLPSKMQPSRYNAVYTNDFHLADSDPRVEAFQSTYVALTGEEANDLAFVGYDLAQFLVYALTSATELPLHEYLPQAAPYAGIALRLDFSDGNVNRALFFERYRNGRSELLY